MSRMGLHLETCSSHCGSHDSEWFVNTIPAELTLFVRLLAPLCSGHYASAVALAFVGEHSHGKATEAASAVEYAEYFFPSLGRWPAE